MLNKTLDTRVPLSSSNFSSPREMRWFVTKAIISTSYSSFYSSRWLSVSLAAVLRPYGVRRWHVSLLQRKLEEKNSYPKAQKSMKGPSKITRRLKDLDILNNEDHQSHILWWREKMQKCRKLSAVQLIKRLVYSNLLGLDDSLKNGSLKEGTLNFEILQFKARFPREVLLCRVGDFYEAIGFDACVLVEHAGLNPFGGLRSDSIPKAGCPVVNLRQTLDDLTRSGFSVVSIYG